MKITLIRGIPGSGKSTYAKKNYNCLILETDMLCYQNGSYNWSAGLAQFRHSVAKEITERVLSADSDIVVCNTFTQIWEIQPYLDLANKYAAEVEIIRMTNEYDSIHNVPKKTIWNMKNRFENYQGEVLI